MPVRIDGPAPYTPPHTIQTVLNRVRDVGIPRSPFTLEVLVRMNITESLAPRTFQSLKLLELINEDGTATQQLRDLRTAKQPEYQEALANYVRKTYADYFEYIKPEEDSFDDIREQFRRNTPHSQMGRMAKLFVGLCELAGIAGEIPQRQRSSKPRNETSSPRRASTATRRSQSQKSSGQARKTEGLGWDLYPSAVTGMIKALPKDGEGWTESQRDKFIETFRLVLEFSYPPVEPPIEESKEEDHD